MRHSSRRISGFTLTELAIVLAVVGVLAAGIWNLLSSANTQMRDESAASQQSQVIAAVKGYLSSPLGQNFLDGNAGAGCGGGICGALAAFTLPLPTACFATGIGTFPAPYAGDANLTGTLTTSGFCTFLPPGFLNTTTNSYSQKYAIQIWRDATLNPVGATPPNTFSFMVMTTGGTNITDTSGARISAQIGGDGGFIYNNAVCGAVPATACGAYGGWTATPVTYSFGLGAVPAPASGTIASRTYVSPQENSLSDWLARIAMPGDATHTLNTMQTAEFLGGNALVMGSFNALTGVPPIAVPTKTGASLYMGRFGDATNGGDINLQAGSFNFISNPASAGGALTGTMNAQLGSIFLNTSSAADITYDTGLAPGLGAINLQGGLITSSLAGVPTGNDAINLTGAVGNANAVITANQACTISQYDQVSGNWEDSTGAVCGFAIQTNSLQSPGLISAAGFYAGTFVYKTSDIRLKKNIRTLVDPLDDVMRLNPVSFTYKSNGLESMGVIAQQLEKVYPQLVSSGDKGMKYVDYDGLIGPLIGAVQQLKKENDELRQELKDEKTRQEKFEKELHQNANQ